MSVYSALLSLIGDPPAGYDIVVWVVAAVFGLYLVCSAFSVIWALLSYIGGK